jgi:recombination protein RecR
VLALLKRRETLGEPLRRALADCLDRVATCAVCGNLDLRSPCGVCGDATREPTLLVVEEVEDVWAMERSGAWRGRYHVLGGRLSALDGRGPEALCVDTLLARAAEPGLHEIVLALSATVDGQTTSHYLAERLRPLGRKVTRLGHGVPVGGELTYLDEGTITAALRSRQPVA